MELNLTGALYNLSPSNEHKSSFDYLHIHMYPSVTLSLFPEVCRNNHTCMVIDFGVMNPNLFSAFSQCDIMIMIGNICPWNWKQYLNNMNTIKENHKNIYKNILFLSSYGSKENQSNIIGKFPNSIISIPFIENPFQITSEYFGFFERLLESK